MPRIIAGEWGGRRLEFPKGRRVRPTADRVREAWMSALGGSFPGYRVLDLFAGSGALGLEMLSRGAAEAIFVERDATALRSLRRNVESLEAGGHCRIVREDAFRFLDRADEPDFEVALADPPYGEGHAARLLRRFAERPFARVLWVEHRTGETLPPLPHLSQRTYGDTTLTGIEADPATTPAEPPP